MRTVRKIGRVEGNVKGAIEPTQTGLSVSANGLQGISVRFAISARAWIDGGI